jgi:hypothetical protein
MTISTRVADGCLWPRYSGAATLLALWCCVRCAFAGEPAIPAHLAEEFRIKREAVFAFEKTPAVTRHGDKVTIAFATKGFCDATVAVEDGAGKILRHLASGVLGPKAPPPFLRNTKEQAIVWDSKNDKGEYVDDIPNTVIRVSLGLRARFERHFLWSPHRPLITGYGMSQSFCAQPEGVYVYDGNMVDHLRLFDHQGQYIRTVYPFGSAERERAAGVRTRVFEQSGTALPWKGGFFRSTLLTSGANTRARTGESQLHAPGVTAMSVRSGRVALAMEALNRLATDGTTGGLPLEGPSTSVNGQIPRSIALSPDGKTLYVTGLHRDHNSHPHLATIIWVQGVGKIDFENGKPMEPFAGALSIDPKTSGSGAGQFKSPVSVATDPQGRVYVADLGNERIQIFAPDGKHLRNIAIPGGRANLPSEVAVNQRNGDIYVFSWFLTCHHHALGCWDRREKLFHFGPFDNPVLKGEYNLPLPSQSRRGRYGGDKQQGREFRAGIDPWAAADGTVNVWIVRGAGTPPAIYRIAPQNKQLELVADFATFAKDADVGSRSFHDTQLLVNPRRGDLHLGATGLVIHLDSGKIRTMKYPHGWSGYPEMNFDADGHAYTCSGTTVARFDASTSDTWREVPFDYGEEIAGRIAALPTGGGPFHTGGITVSPKGNVVASVIVGSVKETNPEKEKLLQQVRQGSKPWTPLLYVGRGGIGVVRVWNRFGKMVYDDAVRGIGYMHNVFMDKDDAMYVATGAKRAGYADINTATVVKIQPGGKIFSTDATLPMKQPPTPTPDTHSGAIGGAAWWENAAWFYGGIGYNGKNSGGIHPCHCKQFRITQDYYARTFVPETVHYTVGVLDSEGNLIMRIGQYGNVDDGVPMVPDLCLPQPRPLGGDETAFFHPAYLGVHTDRRLLVNDPGNDRIVSVKLDYHTTERVPLAPGSRPAGNSIPRPVEQP